MAQKMRLTQQLKLAEKNFELACRYGDEETVDLTKAKVDLLRAQKKAIEDKLSERGTIGRFSDGSMLTSQQVIDRRKRSAVFVEDVYQLPVISDAKRASPNCLLRGALFSVMKKGERALLMRQKVATQGNYEVFFSGAQLDQADLDVWLHCLHLSKDCVGQSVEVGLLSFLRAIGRAEGTASQSWLRDSLVRLGMAVIQVKQGDVTLMIQDRMVVYEELEQTNKSTISLRVSPSIANLFGVASWTALDLSVRAGLLGKPLAQWLHAFLATHREPIPIPVTTLWELSGSKTGELRMFRRTLKQAAGHLGNP